MSVLSTLKHPSAFVPLAMSVVALAMVPAYVAMFGVGQSGGDEGIAARIFQLLLVAQVPIVAFFAFRWLPRAPWQALLVLALQGAAAFAATATIVFVESLQ